MTHLSALLAASLALACRPAPVEAPKPPAYMADPSIHQVLYLTPKGFLPAERPGLLFLDAATGEYGPAKEARR